MRRIVTEDPRTLGDLLKDLRDQFTLLFRQEVDLARTEMTNKARRAGRDSLLLLAGAGVGLLAVIVLGNTLAAAGAALFALFLDVGVAVWLGPLVVTLVLGAIAWGLVQAGLNKLKQQHFRPDQTVQSLREDKQWLQEKIHS